MRRLLLLTLMLMLFGAVAYADPTEWTFLNWNGGDWTNGYPYYIQPTNGPNSLVYAVMCDDYAHGGMPGDQWEANTTILGSRNITLTRFNNLTGPDALFALRLYDEAGWILLQTQVEPFGEWKDMTYAVWHIFDPQAPLIGDAQSWITAAQEQAHVGFPGSDFNKVYILTPVNQHDPDPNSMQEFMYLGPDTSSGQSNNAPGATTPEPGTFLLFGTGVLALLRKRIFS
jgi:hypothetical protein